MKNRKNLLLALAILIIIPISLGVMLRSYMGTPKKVPKLPRYFAITKDFQSDYSKVVNDTLWHIVPPFSFTDQSGKTLTEKDFEGNIFIADFFFTACPGICPIMTESIKTIQNRMRSKVDNLMYLSHTVDPERDTPEVLKAYGERFGADFRKWKFVTGPESELYDICRNGYLLGVGPGEEGSAEEFDHSGRLVLLDRDRVIRGYYMGTDPESVEKLMNDILLLQIEYEKVDREFDYKVEEKQG